jgi:hypothetical protein
MSTYSGIYQAFEGTKTECDSIQQIRETVYVSDSGCLRYKTGSGLYVYLGQTGPSGVAGPTGQQGPSGVAGPSGVGSDLSGSVDFGPFYTNIEGFSAVSTSGFYWKKIGNTAFIWFNVFGTSNSSGLAFTLPWWPHSSLVPTGTDDYFGVAVVNNDSGLTKSSGAIRISGAYCCIDYEFTKYNWPDESGKGAYGQISYECYINPSG